MKTILHVLLLAGLASSLSAQAGDSTLDRYIERVCEAYGEAQAIRLLGEFGNTGAVARKMKLLEDKLYGLGEDVDPVASGAAADKAEWGRFMRAQDILKQVQQIKSGMYPQ